MQEEDEQHCRRPFGSTTQWEGTATPPGCRLLSTALCNWPSQSIILQQKIPHSTINLKKVLKNGWARKSNCCRNKNYTTGNLQKHPNGLQLRQLSSQTALQESVALLLTSILRIIFTLFAVLGLTVSERSLVVHNSFCIQINILLQNSNVLWEIIGDYIKDCRIPKGRNWHQLSMFLQCIKSKLPQSNSSNPTSHAVCSKTLWHILMHLTKAALILLVRESGIAYTKPDNNS